MGVPMTELEIPNDLDLEPINKEIVRAVPDLKARDIFKLIEVHEKALVIMREVLL
jgi:hypothetical protein